MKKKVIATMLAGALAVGMLAGCGSKQAKKTDVKTEEAADAKAEASGGEGQYNVVFICSDMANESQNYSASQFEKYGADYGLNVTVLDSKGDPQTESQLVNNCIAQGVDAIFLNPNDVNGIVPSVMEAKEAGLVVGLFSGDLPEEAKQYRDFFVGVDDNKAGETAAQAFIDHFPDGAKIVEVGGQAGHDAQIKRHDGFDAVIKNSNIEVMDSKSPTTWSSSEAMTIMEDFVVKYGDEIQGVFCHWDNGATGVIEALSAAGMNDVYVVAVDGCRAGFEQVQDGKQAATIMQNFVTMSQKSLELCRDVLDGKDVQTENFIDLDTVTLENIDSFEIPEW